MITSSTTYFLEEDLFGENAKVIFGNFSLSEPVKWEIGNWKWVLYLRQLFDLDF